MGSKITHYVIIYTSFFSVVYRILKILGKSFIIYKLGVICVNKKTSIVSLITRNLQL